LNLPEGLIFKILQFWGKNPFIPTLGIHCPQCIGS
jgi:hypothetical protein